MDKTFILATNFWERCMSHYAHLKVSDKTIQKGNMTEKILKEGFLDHVSFKNKTIIDYGCGGGFLGLYLFINHGIKKYIAVDIAKRSLKVAFHTLRNYQSQCSFYPSQLYLKEKADIFVSLACIQHFPTQDYFNSFLMGLNKSNIKTIVLQIRYSDKTEFNGAYISKENSVGLSCRTNAKYMNSILTNYKLERQSRLFSEVAEGYQYLIFERTSC